LNLRIQHCHIWMQSYPLHCFTKWLVVCGPIDRGILLVKRGTCIKLNCSVTFVVDCDRIAEFVSQKKYQFRISDSLLLLHLIPLLW